jgi:hypothetical protein
MPLLSNEEEKK